MAEAHHPEVNKLGTAARHFSLSTIPPLATALFAWMIVFIFHAAAGLWYAKDRGHRLAILFDAAATGAVIAALTWLGLTAFRRVRRQNECNTAEVNHQVRNALELIIDAEYRAEGAARRSLIVESVSRIDRTLRKLLPNPRK